MSAMTPTPTTPVIRRTPLDRAHRAAGARMVPFAGWEMPVHYGSQIEEHHATRRGAAIFDVSHMGQIEVTGPGALGFVQEAVTRDIAKLGDGEQAYCVLCREDGGLVDDLIVGRFGAEHYFLVVNAATYEGDVAFLREVADGLSLAGVKLDPCADRWAMIALQGPKWIEIGRQVIGGGEWEKLDSYRILRMDHEGAPMILSTTGYTGEAGCELMIAPDKAMALWNALAEAGAKPAGLAARDTLRLEKAMCLSGQDFTVENHPFEARLGWVVDLDKPSFSGKTALEKIKAEGARRRLAGIAPEGRRIPRHGNKILSRGQEIGVITSGGFSPSLGRPIALGYVAMESTAIGTELQIDLGRTKTAARVVGLPFYPERS